MALQRYITGFRRRGWFKHTGRATAAIGIGGLSYIELQTVGAAPHATPQEAETGQINGQASGGYVRVWQ